MSIVNLSLDTVTRQVVLTINGMLVTTSDVLIEKYEFDGEEFIRFQYTVESSGPDGMEERRQFFLPSPDLSVDAIGGVNEDGFASRAVRDDEKAKADTIDYLKRDNKPE